MFNVNVISLILFYARPLVKWFLRRFTRLCELQRICYGSELGSRRLKDVERSLALSRTEQIKCVVRVLDDKVASDLTLEELRKQIIPYAVKMVVRVKCINPVAHPDFAPILRSCLEAIWGYKRLYQVIEERRTTSYDCANNIHEEQLLRLWHLLMPDTDLEARITKQWQDIGFQGDNPWSDFRGMGILGLENLIYFAEEYNGAARHVLSHSHHPKHGYTFAIVGINLTSMAYHLFKSGMAKTHIYNLGTNQPTLRHFHKFYCYLFYEFDKYWMECKPRSIMDFSNIHDKFRANIESKLQDDGTVFKINLSVDDV